MKIFQKVQRWYNGEDIRDFPDYPDTIGGLGVIHSYHKKFHWTAKTVRSLVAFYMRNWKWIIPTILTALTTYIAFITFIK